MLCLPPPLGSTAATTAFIHVSIAAGTSLTPTCSNGQWALFGFNFRISTTNSDGKITGIYI